MRAHATAMVMHPVVRDELLRNDHVSRLQANCSLISSKPFQSFEDLGSAADEMVILISSWGCPRIDTKVLDNLPRLRLIAHLAGSVKGFIDESAWRRGIKITNAVSANAVPVAEYTLAAILFANKRVFQLNQAYLDKRENRAPWTREAPNVGNYQKTVGIVGASSVGRLVIEYLQKHDVKTLVYDPYITPLEARRFGAAKAGLAELLANSDVVSLHAPLLPETRNLIGARELALMKDHSTFINTARGRLVDHVALINELKTGRLFAILDTTEPEIPPSNSPLYSLPNVFLTPHIAGSLGTETQRLSDCIVDEIERFTRGMPLHNAVKREQLARLA